jgi:glutathione synthase
MADIISRAVIADAIAQALQSSLCFLAGPGQCRHVPFTFSPAPITAAAWAQMVAVAPLLGRLTQQLANDYELIQAAHAPLAAGDPFFAELLSMHQELQNSAHGLPRLPLLLQRSDFMLDARLGPRLVECNSIAAGMAPFGDKMHQLHAYLVQRWPREYALLHSADLGELLPNPATANMARAIELAARHPALSSGGDEQPGFLMVVQEDEDNLFDQRLLEQELETLGIRTFRRTFRQLHHQLTTGPGQSLQLEGCGRIHVAYLRAGYQHKDYLATDLDSRRCCDALRATRLFIERHLVAVNATVAQQLATSKRMQLLLANDDGSLLRSLGFDAREGALLRNALVTMRSIDEQTATQLRQEGSAAAWVLKNQGEGGGHCLFDRDILARLDTLEPNQFAAWTLMQRLLPVGRDRPTVLVRDGSAQTVQELVSETGLFTAHLGLQPLAGNDSSAGLLGYLVRSKPPDVLEGGVHSGFGAVDSLFVASSGST